MSRTVHRGYGTGRWASITEDSDTRVMAAALADGGALPVWCPPDTLNALITCGWVDPHRRAQLNADGLVTAARWARISAATVAASRVDGPLSPFIPED
jgi:hypothetical protein